MSVEDKTEQGQVEAIRFEIELRHAPAKVWRALTEPALLERWLLPVFDLKLERGAAFRFQTQAYPGWDGSVLCEMQEIEPLRTLRYTWRAIDVDTVVTFSLEPNGAGTRLTLVQSGFKSTQKQASGGARYGWKMMGDKLVALLDLTGD